MASDFSIQPYDDALHRSGVMHLWNVAFNQPTGHNAPALSLDKKRAMRDGLLFVAVQQGQVVGTTMAGYDGHRGWMYSVAVLPTHRKRGIGAALVSHAEQALVQRGCAKINLQITGGNEVVIGFYEALGYVQEPRTSMGKIIRP